MSLSTETVALLIARYGIPAGLKIVEILSSGAVFTPEMGLRLHELGSRDAGDYEREPQA